MNGSFLGVLSGSRVLETRPWNITEAILYPRIWPVIQSWDLPHGRHILTPWSQQPPPGWAAWVWFFIPNSIFIQFWISCFISFLFQSIDFFLNLMPPTFPSAFQIFAGSQFLFKEKLLKGCGGLGGRTSPFWHWQSISIRCPSSWLPWVSKLLAFDHELWLGCYDL